ncbi:MAG: DNA mismatch endonuclease Vsr [Chloroflexi bacterium]|nr:DNA mismatch endonuclease Vsr [Chloroflexota bacterium]
MRSTRQSGTVAEQRIRTEFEAEGLRYQVDQRVLPGLRRRADFVFTAARIAIFVDGCFWHGCPEHATWPKANAAWWRTKIETNRARDRDTNRRLTGLGWTVIRIWEHEDSVAAARRVSDLVHRFAASAHSDLHRQDGGEPDRHDAE